ncbi:site-specific integrase [Pontibacter sp. FD36]|uniref:site-specific integrase n=1 Tax=Pontibacter sp. FD36 TaxID=2789860 RepID=UPI0018AA5910|nr:site-specific integrase [Pontibacter sp. FD36]MBF8962954.1 site-specific integrase [Pontibacter sp. FD36]
MNTTYKPILNNKPKADGTYTIMIRITTAKKHKYIAVGHSVKKQDWNAATQNGRYVKSSNILHKVINTAIDNKLIELKTLASELSISNSQTIRKAAKGHISEDFFVFAERNLQLLKAAKQISTYKKRKSVVEGIKTYMNGRKLLFKDITVEFLEDYNKHLHTNTQNKINTINTKFRTLRAIVYEGIRKDLMKQADNPFFKFSLVREKTKKDKLSATELKSIEDLSLEDGSALWHIRNYFMFAYLNFGMRFSDFASLKWDNIQNENKTKRLVYQMGKTGEWKNILLNKKSLSILDKYLANRDRTNPYIFPLLPAKFDSLSEEKQHNLISSKNAVVNKQLKTLATQARVKTNLTFHIARHTFATLARDKGLNIVHIQKALGHSSLIITETYLESLTDKSLDSFNDLVYND